MRWAVCAASNLALPLKVSPCVSAKTRKITTLRVITIRWAAVAKLTSLAAETITRATIMIDRAVCVWTKTTAQTTIINTAKEIRIIMEVSMVVATQEWGSQCTHPGSKTIMKGWRTGKTAWFKALSKVMDKNRNSHSMMCLDNNLTLQLRQLLNKCQFTKWDSSKTLNNSLCHSSLRHHSHRHPMIRQLLISRLHKTHKQLQAVLIVSQTLISNQILLELISLSNSLIKILGKISRFNNPKIKLMNFWISFQPCPTWWHKFNNQQILRNNNRKLKNNCFSIWFRLYKKVVVNNQPIILSQTSCSSRQLQHPKNKTKNNNNQFNSSNSKILKRFNKIIRTNWPSV